jgi:hypothetical protein
MAITADKCNATEVLLSEDYRDKIQTVTDPTSKIGRRMTSLKEKSDITQDLSKKLADMHL